MAKIAALLDKNCPQQKKREFWLKRMIFMPVHPIKKPYF